MATVTVVTMVTIINVNKCRNRPYHIGFLPAVAAVTVWLPYGNHRVLLSRLPVVTTLTMLLLQ